MSLRMEDRDSPRMCTFPVLCMQRVGPAWVGRKQKFGKGLYKMPEKQGAGGVFEYHVLAHLHDSSQTGSLQETWAVPPTAAEQH